jgi:hypothetical protein
MYLWHLTLWDVPWHWEAVPMIPSTNRKICWHFGEGRGGRTCIYVFLRRPKDEDWIMEEGISNKRVSTFALQSKDVKRAKVCVQASSSSVEDAEQRLYHLIQVGKAFENWPMILGLHWRCSTFHPYDTTRRNHSFVAGKRVYWRKRTREIARLSN